MNQKKSYLFLTLLLIGITLLFLIYRWINPFVSISSKESNTLGFFRAESQLTVVTLERIFKPEHTLPDGLDPKRITIMLTTGDIIPARTVNYKVLTYGDFLWPYKYTASLLSGADLTLVNLESPLLTNCPVVTTGMTFCGDARNVSGLVYAGVDVANLANNHAGNYGQPGLVETENILNTHQILPTGLGKITYKDVGGRRFAFLGYNDLWGDPDLMTQNVKIQTAEAKRNADIVVVSYHWGIEYRRQPTDRQRELAHDTIDAGADLIIGNHPHWIQPVELYGDKFIIYAHGNFVFDQMWSTETTIGVVGKFTFYDASLIDVEFIPIKIKDFGQPYILAGDEKTRVLGMLTDASILLAQSSK